MFSESLTVRILADSSSFRGELDNALSQLDRFRESVRTSATAGSTLADSFSQLSQAIGPLQQISKLLSGIGQQIRAIGQTPLTIDVSQAIGSLMSLLNMIDMVAARLRALSMPTSLPGVGGPGGIPGGGPPGVAPGVGGPLPGLPGKYGATAPFIAAAMSGPRSAAALRMPIAPEPRDVIVNLPALAEPAITGDRIASPTPAPSLAGSSDAYGTTASRAAVPAESSTTNHFGGITIQVRETADVNTLVRDLRLQGIHLRNRRG